MTLDARRLTRRRMIIAGVSLPLPFLVGAACGDSENGSRATPSFESSEAPASTPGASSTPATSSTAAANGNLSPTPICGDEYDEPTVAQTEGPYFTPSSPQRTSLLESGMAGTKLLLTGTVVSTGCRPIARALVDFWQCDDAGDYDNDGYRLRGHQFTDADGSYRLETIVPGLYPGRTRHIHVKVQAPNEPVLTTQLYFPGEPRNRQDGIFREECLIENYRDGSGGKEGVFRFVLEA